MKYQLTEEEWAKLTARAKAMHRSRASLSRQYVLAYLRDGEEPPVRYRHPEHDIACECRQCAGQPPVREPAEGGGSKSSGPLYQE